MVIINIYHDYHHFLLRLLPLSFEIIIIFFIINMIILPQAAPLGAAAAAAELTRLFPGRKLPEVAV